MFAGEDHGDLTARIVPQFVGSILDKLVDLTLAVAAFLDRENGSSASTLFVTKKQSESDVQVILDEGHRLFGENRVQEAMGKWPRLREQYGDTALALIGPLQRNKIRDAVKLFDRIESLDRLSLATALAQYRDDHGIALPEMYIQVNVGREAQKSGVDPEALLQFHRSCEMELGLEISGLMAIPPAAEDPRSYFRTLANHAMELGVPNISMGMSGDFETAITCGSTQVRLGTVIFGELKK
ncbi:YggS family pyridoxal phosphate-dependent enzyme [Sphaerimonospora thailandensis]|uniref:YggS family pyridoxal phosphate enzyme n=1 Tax=Sphaerimonospora thailandensis TaxID=795644 RepID=A0A8J3RDD7_9ACTN|nr:YggS family pyridoxal phosphate-dependent enzyme [Sphaerimonospora thailandensis]GIH72570.1 YggS family pyridoxal phosphate enzyme [Sphaerimonospora thailandensis]